MKILRIAGVVLVSMLVLLTGISFLLPQHIKVEREEVMNASPSHVFSFINNLKAWEDWWPGYKKDPKAKWTYSEPAEGKGAWSNWVSDDAEVGNGKATIASSVTDSIVKLEIDREDRAVSFLTFLLKHDGEKTKVTCIMEADLGYNPIARWTGLMIGKRAGDQFERGLKNLRYKAETIPEKEMVSGFEIEKKLVDEVIAITLRRKVKVEDVADVLNKSYMGMQDVLQKQQVEASGAPSVIWHRYSTKEADMEIYIPVKREGKNEAAFVFKEIPGCYAYVINYYGSYSNRSGLYGEGFAFVKSKGKKVSSAPRDRYITNPFAEKDTSKWLTEIVLPID